MQPAPSSQALSMDLFFEEMDQSGITMGVVPGRRGHRMQSISNDDVIELQKMYPDKFIGIAGLNSTDVEDSLNEIQRCVINGPLKGVNLEPGSHSHPVYAHDKSLYPIYELCAAHKIPVMIMLGGRAGPDISYSDPCIIAKLAADFPSVNFIVSHGGWPWVQQILGTCFWTKNIYISPDMYLYNAPGAQDYVAAANNYLQDNFLFGTAYPYVPMIEGVKHFTSLFNPDVLPKILYKNAARLFNINID